MSNDPHTEAVATLGVMFPRPEFTDLTAKTYRKCLTDIPGDELLAAVHSLVASKTGDRPLVADIRRRVIELRGMVPTLAEARVQAEALQRWINRSRVPAGAGRPAANPPKIHPVVKAALDAAGGLDHGPSFAKAYRECAEDAYTALTRTNLSQSEPIAPCQLHGAPLQITEGH